MPYSKLFEHTANKFPSKAAIKDSSREIKYRELYTGGLTLAGYLSESCHVKPGDIVAIIGVPSADYVRACLATLAANAVFLPIDSKTPLKRIEYILNDSSAKVVLVTDPDFIDTAKLLTSARVINSGQDISFVGDSIKAFANEIADDFPAYIIYTSGSTGVPKGVVVSHANLCNLCRWYTDEFSLGKESIHSLYSSVGFDASVWEIFPALAAGATLLPFTPQERLDIDSLVEKISSESITHCFLPSVVCTHLVDNGLKIDERTTIFTGGEALTLKKAPHFTLINNYGPTEATVVTTFCRLQAGRLYDEIPIGKPITNAEIEIIDDNGLPLGVGEEGELCIGGAGIAAGYLNLPTLTNDRFVVLSNRLPDKRFYKTGDIAVLKSDGNFYYRGRKDFQIQINGFRVELQEIERTLSKHPSVRNAAVICKVMVNRKILVAFCECKEDVNEWLLDEHVRTHLPAYMVPHYFVKLDVFPITTNGKIDRHALGDMKVPTTAPNHANHQSDVVSVITQYWIEKLDINYIAESENLLKLGVNSLMAVQFLNFLQERLGLRCTLEDFYQHPRIAFFASQGKTPVATTVSTKLDEHLSNLFSTSHSQKRWWLLSKLNSNSGAYNVQISRTYSLTFDKIIFHKSIQLLVKRHPLLTATFVPDHSEIVKWQTFNPAAAKLPVAFHYANDKHTSASLETLRKTDLSSAFDLGAFPLWKIAVLCTPENWTFVLTVHHILVDGWSINVLGREFDLIYQSLLNKKYTQLPPTVLYATYVAQQMRELSDNAAEPARKYWRAQFQSGFPTLKLPFAKTSNVSVRIESVKKKMTKECQDKLMAAALNRSTSSFTFYLSLIALSLPRLTGSKQNVIGIPAAGRTDPQFNNTVGNFLNTLLLVTRIDQIEDFHSFWQSVSKQFFEMLQYQSFPIEEVLKIAGFNRQNGNNPFILFNFQNFEHVTGASESVSTEMEAFHSEHLNSELDIYLRQLVDGLELAFYFDANRHERARIQVMADDFEYLMHAFVDDAGTIDSAIHRRLQSAPLLMPEATGEHKLKSRLTDDLLSVMSRFAHKEAVRFKQQSVTYKELHRQVIRIAKEIEEDYGQSVALLFDVGSSMISAVLGTLVSGNAYTPLDPLYPDLRLKFMLRDADAKIILCDNTNQTLAFDLRDSMTGIRVINVESFFGEDNANHFLEPVEFRDNDNAYILYTSGSTGNPKGVMQLRKNVQHFIRAYSKKLGITHNDVISLIPNYCFDAAVMDIFTALLNGATLSVFPLRDADAIANGIEWLRSEKVTVFHSTPSVFREFFATREEDEYMPHVRLVVLGGEPARYTDLKIFKRNFVPGNSRLINGLGPTESTVTLQFVMDHASPDSENEGFLPVGFPVEETEVFIVDEKRMPLPDGSIGELALKSKYVSPGYWNNPTLTKKNHTQEGDVITYYSGDVGRKMPSGEFHFISRKDDQVKLRGIRIELGEIENTVTDHEGVLNAVAFVENENLVCCVQVQNELMRESKNIAKIESSIREHLRQRLPQAMVPRQIYVMDNFPKTASLKLDRRKLMDTVRDRSTLPSQRLTAATNELEHQLGEIVKSVLGIADITFEDDFFYLGANSLSIAKIAMSVESTYGVHLLLREVFQNPSIEALTTLIDEKEPSVQLTIPQAERKDYYELSPMQEAIWLQLQVSSHSHYNVPIIYLMTNPDLDLFVACWETAVSRQAITRTSFIAVNGAPKQVVHKSGSSHQSFIRIVSLDDIRESPETFISNEIHRNFDLTSPPLLRITLLKVSEHDYLFLFCSHHMIGDYWSSNILFRDFLSLYDGKPNVPPPTIGYHDYAQWIRQLLKTNYFAGHKDYWATAMKDFTPPEIKLDRPRRKFRSYDGKSISFTISENTAKLHRDYSRHTGITSFTFYFSVLALLTADFLDSPDIIIGTPLHGRDSLQLKDVAGPFVNLLPIRVSLEGKNSFADVTKLVAEQISNANEYQLYPFLTILKELKIAYENNRNPLFDIVMAYEEREASESTSKLIVNEAPQQYNSLLRTSKFDISFLFSSNEKGSTMTIEFNTDLFNETTMEKMGNNYMLLLDKVVSADYVIPSFGKKQNHAYADFNFLSQ